MDRDLLWMCAKGLAAIIGAYAGYLTGFALSYYLGDHGDVGSAAMAVLTIPVAMISGTLFGWLGLRRIERKSLPSISSQGENKSN
jgi:hypothetical protein